MNSLSFAIRQLRHNPVRDNSLVFLLLSGKGIKTFALLSRLYALTLFCGKIAVIYSLAGIQKKKDSWKKAEKG
jgi:hypothetical protein